MVSLNTGNHMHPPRFLSASPDHSDGSLTGAQLAWVLETGVVPISLR